MQIERERKIVLESRVLYLSQNSCPVEFIMHFLNQAIEMEVAATLREFIGSEEDHIEGTPDTESEPDRTPRAQTLDS
jgi:hypothetical protein